MMTDPGATAAMAQAALPSRRRWAGEPARAPPRGGDLSAGRRCRRGHRRRRPRGPAGGRRSAARRRHPRGHQQGGQQGRGPGAPRHREEHLEAETVRVVARRGPTSIVRTGTASSWPLPASTTRTSSRHRRAPPRGPRRVGPTAARRPLAAPARPQRRRGGHRHRRPRLAPGQTDVAIGAAGLEVLSDHAAAPTPTATRSSSPPRPWPTSSQRRPTSSRASPRGAPRRSSAGWHRSCSRRARTGRGPPPWSAARPSDMFGLGAREAVLAALTGRDDGTAASGHPCRLPCWPPPSPRCPVAPTCAPRTRRSPSGWWATSSTGVPPRRGCWRRRTRSGGGRTRPATRADRAVVLRFSPATP